MLLKVLKKPTQLSHEELTKIFKSAIDYSFDKWIIDELISDEDIYSQIPYINIFCKNTGYSVSIKGNYNIEIASSVGYNTRLNTISLFNCLLEIGAIRIN